MNFFSVIITNYNHKPYIEKCISSVLNQTFKNFELIIVDNKSNDGSLEIIKKFKDKRIRLFLISNKGIIAKSRNLGIKKAKSKWIAFLDSDDYWYKRKLEIIHKNIVNQPNYNVFCNNEIFFNTKNSEVKRSSYGPFTTNFYRDLLVSGNKISLSASVINRDFLTNKKILFRENRNFITAEDYDFWLNVAFNKGKFLFIKNVLGVYLLHEKNLSSNLQFHVQNTLMVCKDHVFNIQKFCINKINLYIKVHFRIKLFLFFHLIKNNTSFYSVLVFLLFIGKNPVLTFRYLIFKISKNINLY